MSLWLNTHSPAMNFINLTPPPDPTSLWLVCLVSYHHFKESLLWVQDGVPITFDIVRLIAKPKKWCFEITVDSLSKKPTQAVGSNLDAPKLALKTIAQPLPWGQKPKPTTTPWTVISCLLHQPSITWLAPPTKPFLKADPLKITPYQPTIFTHRNSPAAV